MRFGLATLSVIAVVSSGCGKSEPPEYMANGPPQREALGVPQPEWTTDPFVVRIGAERLRIPAWMVDTVESYDRPVIRGQAHTVVIGSEWPDPRPFTSNPSDRLPGPLYSQIKIWLTLREDRIPSRELTRDEIIAREAPRSSDVVNDFNGTKIMRFNRTGPQADAFFLAPEDIATPNGGPVMAYCRNDYGPDLDLCFGFTSIRNNYSVKVMYTFYRRYAEDFPKIHAYVVSVLDAVRASDGG